MKARDKEDKELVGSLKQLVASECAVIAEVVEHIAEVDARGLFREESCSSMFDYCTRILNLSGDATYKRIQVARLSRRFPEVLRYLAEGRIHLTGLNCLATHLTETNCADVLGRACGRSKREIEEIAVEVTPKPDVPQLVRKLPQRKVVVEQRQIELAPAQVKKVTKTVPLAPERYAIQFTADKKLKTKLDRVKELLHTSDLEQVMDRALDLLIADVEKKRFGKTAKPRQAKPHDPSARYVPQAIKREVFARDGGQCTYRDLFDRPCHERGHLEYDHIIPHARGGTTTVENLRLLCRAHNQLAAEQVYGRSFMQAQRESHHAQPS